MTGDPFAGLTAGLDEATAQQTQDLHAGMLNIGIGCDDASGLIARVLEFRQSVAYAPPRRGPGP